MSVLDRLNPAAPTLTINVLSSDVDWARASSQPEGDRRRQLNSHHGGLEETAAMP